MDWTFHAVGNAGTRVARNVLMMEEIPKVMGRVDSLFRLIGTGIRILLILMLFTAEVGSHAAAFTY